MERTWVHTLYMNDSVTDVLHATGMFTHTGLHARDTVAHVTHMTPLHVCYTLLHTHVGVTRIICHRQGYTCVTPRGLSSTCYMCLTVLHVCYTCMMALHVYDGVTHVCMMVLYTHYMCLTLLHACYMCLRLSHTYSTPHGHTRVPCPSPRDVTAHAPPPPPAPPPPEPERGNNGPNEPHPHPCPTPAPWLPHGYPTPAPHLPHTPPMAALYMPHGCPTHAPLLPHGCPPAQAPRASVSPQPKAHQWGRSRRTRLCHTHDIHTTCYNTPAARGGGGGDM